MMALFYFRRVKKTLHIPVVLMLLAIIAVALFQGYWLQKNYKEEKKVLAIKVNTLFQEAVNQIQVEKLKKDTSFKFGLAEGHSIELREMLETESKAAGLVEPAKARGVIISVNARDIKDSLVERPFKNVDSMSRTVQIFKRPGGQALMQVLRGVDSAKDSVRIADIQHRLDSLLTKDKIDVSYAVDRRLGSKPTEIDITEISKISEVTVGFFNPITFILKIKGANGYLMKKLSIPILVSLFLVGLTVISFLLMWRSLQQQKRLSVLKNEFVSNITHELKTPIATVGVAIEALKNFNAINDPVRTKEYLDISAAEVHRLGLLVDKVLKLSMFENREIALQKEKFDVLELVQDVMASMKLQFEKLEAVVSLEAIGTNFVLEADKLHITSVVYNLIDNALKYSKGKPAIDIVLKSHKEHVSLAVSDKGLGIPPEYKGKIFDKFFRIPGGDRHNIKGYGLGLSYVNHIVKKHMGFVEVKSELGKGSTFIVHIPYKEADKIRFDEFRTIRKESI